ncbi:MAG: type II toxin-antitoxin system VapC family toxin [Verrucomicrobiota bacterium]
MKPKIYIETTIPSMLVARPSRQVLIAGQQQATRDWWTQRRQRFDLYVSVFVTREIAQGDTVAAKQRAAVLADCGVLPFPKEAEALTRALLASRLIPAKAETDAAHVATAAVHGMDFLLTWNCRHIANAVIVEKLRAVCEREGFSAPVICTPHELMI